MKADLLDPADQRWANVLTRCTHDVYHLPAYVALEADRLGGTAAGLVVEDGDSCLVVPLIIRELPPELQVNGLAGRTDAVTPYGYSGPIWNAPNNTEASFLDKAIPAGLDFLRERGVVSLFARCHPILQRQDSLPVGKVVRHGEVYWLDLSNDAEELHRQVRPRFRSYINRAIREGTVFEIDRDWVHLGRFIELYHRTMEEVGAGDWYFFSEDYFNGLRDAWGERLVLCVLKVDGVVLAAGMFTECNSIVQYHLSGRAADPRADHLTKVMMVSIRDWAKSRGNRWLNLGGAVGSDGDSPLTFFKRSFTKDGGYFHSWRCVLDPEGFDEATALCEKISGRKLDREGPFFPAYRANLHR